MDQFKMCEKEEIHGVAISCWWCLLLKAVVLFEIWNAVWSNQIFTVNISMRFCRLWRWKIQRRSALTYRRLTASSLWSDRYHLENLYEAISICFGLVVLAYFIDLPWKWTTWTHIRKTATYPKQQTFFSCLACPPEVGLNFNIIGSEQQNHCPISEMGVKPVV